MVGIRRSARIKVQQTATASASASGTLTGLQPHQSIKRGIDELSASEPKSKRNRSLTAKAPTKSDGISNVTVASEQVEVTDETQNGTRVTKTTTKSTKKSTKTSKASSTKAFQVPVLNLDVPHYRTLIDKHYSQIDSSKLVEGTMDGVSHILKVDPCLPALLGNGWGAELFRPFVVENPKSNGDEHSADEQNDLQRYYEHLCRGILAQQISGAAARSIVRKFKLLFLD